MMQKTFRPKRLISLTLSMLIALGTIPSTAAFANEPEELLGIGGAANILSQVGNPEMKALGESLLTGQSAAIVAVSPSAAQGTTYYVDSEDGDDTNSGTAEDAPWQSIEKINSHTFQPGDQILLKANSVWSEKTLEPQGSGAEDAPIVLGSYGEGNKPKLVGNAQVGELVLLTNQQYWEIRDLEISNTAAGFTGTRNTANGEKLGDFRGIRIAGGNSSGTLNGFRLHNLYIHDVTGEVNWISGTPTGEAGINHKKGWDGSKRTGAIVFEILEPDTDDTPTVFNDITIEKCVLNNNSFGGIIIKQWRGDFHTPQEQWAARDGGRNNAPTYDDTNWHPHTNVTIQDNYFNHSDSAYACNTIYVTSTKNALVQRNVSKGAGTSAIEMYYTDNTVIQNNEVYDTIVKAGGADSNAIDPDKEATNALIQYNYIHGTGDGILLCGFIFGSSIVRYNVIQDAEKRYINPHGDRGHNYIYNNILYNTREGNTVSFIDSSGGNGSYLSKSANMHYFYNNIFYNAASTTKSVIIGEGVSTAYDSNAYYGKGIAVPTQDENAIVANPQFVGTPASGQEVDLSGLALSPTSPLIGAGKAIEANHTGLTLTGNGDRDLAVNTLYNGLPDIGIFEYQGTQDQTGTLSGYVYDQHDNLMPGSVVSIDGTNYSAEADETGFFSITGIPVGTYNATITKNVYEEGTAGPFDIVDTDITFLNVKLGNSTSTVGGVTGTISNSSGPIHDVAITVSNAEQSVYTGKTNANGEYTIEDIQMGNGYTITAEKAGYFSATAENINILPGTLVTVNLTLSKDIRNTTYLINENFDSYDIGSFEGNALWSAFNSSASNAITVEEDPENSQNRYLKLSKTASGNIGIFNTESIEAEGIITIEARVKRTTAGSSANQFGMYSFHDSSFNTSSPHDSKKPIATFALSKGGILTHNVKDGSATVKAADHAMDQWYVIRNVVNLDTMTFDFYVDDMNVAKLSNQPLRTQDFTSINKFLIYSNSSNLGDILVDYFRVCTGTPSDYDDASISELIVTDDNQDPIALTQLDDTHYSAEVSSTVSAVTVAAQTVSRFAEATVDGDAATIATPAHVTLGNGQQTITLQVKAESGKIVTYSIQLNKMDEGAEASLTALSLSGTTLAPAFHWNTYSYTAEAVTTDSVQIHYTPINAICSVTVYVNNNAVNSDSLPLEIGENEITVYVESADGTANSTYTVTVKRQTSDDGNSNGGDNGGSEPSNPGPSGGSSPSKPAQIIRGNEGVEMNLNGARFPQETDLKDIHLSAEKHSAEKVSTLLATIPNLPQIKSVALFNLDLQNAAKQSVSFDGTVTVRLPIPDGMSHFVRVFHWDEGVTFAEIPAVINGDMLEFTVEHFSYYAVVDFASSAGTITGNLTASEITNTSPEEEVTSGTAAPQEDANPLTGNDPMPLALAAGALMLVVISSVRKSKKA